MPMNLNQAYFFLKYIMLNLVYSKKQQRTLMLIAHEIKDLKTLPKDIHYICLKLIYKIY